MDVGTPIRDRLERAGCSGTVCAMTLDGGVVVLDDVDVCPVGGPDGRAASGLP
jgi:hypothetical protein